MNTKHQQEETKMMSLTSQTSGPLIGEPEKKKKAKDYKIRELEQGDREFLSGMIEKVALEVSDGEILGLITMASGKDAKNEGDASPTRIKLGIKIIQLLMQFLNKDLKVWFADLVGVSVEEFTHLPFNVEIEIIRQLQEADELTDFFIGASQQFSGILALNKQSKEKKTK
jgi:hypothetical protein